MMNNATDWIKRFKQVLIVDDSGTARMIVQQCLEIAGLRDKTFLQAANGQEALAVMQGQTPDLIVTDLNMPVMDGETLLVNVRSRPDWRDIFVLVITSASNPAKEEEMKRLGANAVISKPVSPAAIVKVFNR